MRVNVTLNSHGYTLRVFRERVQGGRGGTRRRRIRRGRGVKRRRGGYKEGERVTRRGRGGSKPLNNLSYILISPLMWKEQNAAVLAPAIHHVSVNLQNNE